MAGFLNMLQAPDAPQTVPLDAGSQGLLYSGYQRASGGPSEFAARTNQGINQATNLGPSDNSIMQDAMRTGQDSGMLQAIHNRYKAVAGDQIQNLESHNDMSAHMQRAEHLRQMTMAAMGQQAAQTKQYEFLNQVYNQQEAARAQLVSSLFQTAGYAYGMAKGRSKGGGPNNAGNPATEAAIMGMSNNLGGGRMGGYQPSQNDYGNDVSDIG